MIWGRCRVLTQTRGPFFCKVSGSIGALQCQVPCFHLGSRWKTMSIQTKNCVLCIDIVTELQICLTVTEFGWKLVRLFCVFGSMLQHGQYVTRIWPALEWANLGPGITWLHWQGSAAIAVYSRLHCLVGWSNQTNLAINSWGLFRLVDVDGTV